MGLNVVSAYKTTRCDNAEANWFLTLHNSTLNIEAKFFSEKSHFGELCTTQQRYQ
jgi:hypothetical protein